MKTTNYNPSLTFFSLWRDLEEIDWYKSRYIQENVSKLFTKMRCMSILLHRCKFAITITYITVTVFTVVTHLLLQCGDKKITWLYDLYFLYLVTITYYQEFFYKVESLLNLQYLSNYIISYDKSLKINMIDIKYHKIDMNIHVFLFLNQVLKYSSNKMCRSTKKKKTSSREITCGKCPTHTSYQVITRTKLRNVKAWYWISDSHHYQIENDIWQYVEMQVTAVQ